MIRLQVTCLDVTHGTKVVNFGRLYFRNDGNQVRGIAKIPIVQKQLHPCLVTISVDVVNTTSVKGGRTTDNSMDLTREREESEFRCAQKRHMTVRLVT